jgi:hypothetical protein
MNVQAVPAAGGSLLPNTTYYVRVYALAADMLPYRTGIISDEISFQTTATDLSANLSWDAVIDSWSAMTYAVLLRSTPEYPSRPLLTTNYYYTTDATTYLVTSDQPDYYTIHPFLCPADFPAGLDKFNGRGICTLEGGDENDPITAMDVYNAVADENYCVIDSDKFYFQGSLYGFVYPYYFREVDHHVWMAGLPTPYQNGDFVFGEAGVKSLAVQVVPNTFIRPTYTVDRTLTFNNCLVEQCGKWYFSSGGNMYPWLNLGGVKSNDSIFFSVSWTITHRSAACEFKNTWLQGAHIFNIMSYDNDMVGVVDCSSLSMDLFSCYDGTRIHRNTIRGTYSGVAHIRLSSGYSSVPRLYLIDLTIESETPLGPNIPNMYFYATNPQLIYPHTHLLNTVTITLVDHEGNSIDGIITVTDGADESAVYSTVGGTKTFEVDKGYVYLDTTLTLTPETAHTLYENKNPFTITIESSGKETYTFVGDITEAVDWTIAMLPSWRVFATGIDATIASDLTVAVEE